MLTILTPLFSFPQLRLDLCTKIIFKNILSINLAGHFPAVLECFVQEKQNYSNKQTELRFSSK